jgi:hypothetical protein
METTPATTTKPAAPAKPIFKSRTLVINAAIIVASFIPAIADWVSDNPTDTLALLGAGNVVLRLITKSRVCLWADQ